MSAPIPIAEEEEAEDWLTTYADAITLLMAFFVMLLTFSKYDVPAMQEAMQGIKNKIGGKVEKNTTTKLKDQIEDIVYNMQADQVIKVAKDDKGVVIELASKAFYKPGSADLTDQAIPVLNRLTQTLMAPNYSGYQIEIEGHTDDDPISTARYPSNWELSAGRATRVVRFLIERGMVPKKLKAVGLADTDPKAPNRTADGTPIPQNQADNRRVNVRIFPMSLTLKKKLSPKPKGMTDLIESTGPAVPSATINTGLPKADEGTKATKDMMQDVLKGLSGSP
jgi:chemotaxis protein MotB